MRATLCQTQTLLPEGRESNCAPSKSSQVVTAGKMVHVARGCTVARQWGTRSSAARRQQGQRGGRGGMWQRGGRGKGVAGGECGMLHPSVERVISSNMGSCHITGCALHTLHGSNHSSVYVYTSSTVCAHAQHNSNRALAELDCARMRWRILCRGRCAPGAWQQLAAASPVPSAQAPAWLPNDCAKWCP
jgi:hypothetical protein